MTHERDPLHPLDALNLSCKQYPGGVDGLAKRLGVATATMYKKLDYRVDSHVIRYDGELSDLLFELKHAGVPTWDRTLHALCHQHGGVFVRLPDMTNDLHGHAQLVTTQVLKIVKEQGEVASVLCDALYGDGDIDSKELKAFNQQHEEAVAALVALGEMVKSLHEQARKAGRVR